MIIRAWEPGDINGICSVLEKTWKAAYRGLIDSAYLDAIRAERWTALLQKGMKTETAWGIVACEGAEVVGVAIWSDAQAGCGELTALYILPGFQRKGLGRQLLEAAEAGMKRRGMKHCELTVLKTNSKATGFYESCGYRTAGEVLVPLGGEQAECLLMRKALG